MAFKYYTHVNHVYTFVLRHDEEKQCIECRSFDTIKNTKDINITTTSKAYDTDMIERYVNDKVWKEIDKETANNMIRSWIKQILKYGE